MKHWQRTVYPITLSFALCLVPQTLNVLADNGDGVTDFWITYEDSSGLRAGSEDLRVEGSEGTITLEPEMLTLPDGFVLGDAWQPYSTPAGQDLGVTIPVVCSDPEVEAIIASQNENPKTLGVSALTLNYRTEDGSLVDSKSYFYEDLRAIAGGSPERTLREDWDYVITPPEGYALNAAPAQSYSVPNGARTLVDLRVVPGTDSTYPSKDPADGDYTAYITFYEAQNGQRRLVSAQHIPYTGDGTISVTQNLIELPEGYRLKMSWPVQDPFVSNANLAMPVEVAAVQSSSAPASSTAVPSSSGAAGSSILPGTRRAASVNTGAELSLHTASGYLGAAGSILLLSVLKKRR